MGWIKPCMTRGLWPSPEWRRAPAVFAFLCCRWWTMGLLNWSFRYLRKEHWDWFLVFDDDPLEHWCMSERPVDREFKSHQPHIFSKILVPASCFFWLFYLEKKKIPSFWKLWQNPFTKLQTTPLAYFLFIQLSADSIFDCILRRIWIITPYGIRYGQNHVW